MLKTLEGSAPIARVDRVELRILDLPFRRLQRFARLDARAQSVLLVSITTACGAVGHGETVVPCGPWWSGDSIEALHVVARDHLAPLLVGTDPADVAGLTAAMDRAARGNRFARAGIEMALLDLTGRLLGVPVHVLLGGRLRDRVPVAWPLASGDPGRDRDEIEKMLGTGRASAFKVKMGAETLRSDLARVAALAEALAGRAGLRVDPNESWTEIDAMAALPRLREIGVELIEQPVPREQPTALARIARAAGVPIMVDEGVCTEADMLDVACRGAAHLVSLKVMKSGGLHASARIAAIAASAGIPAYLGTFLESSLGTAAGLHLAAAIPDLPLGGEVIGPMLLAEDLTHAPVVYEGGAALLPSGPGLGVSPDPDLIERFARA